MLSRIKELVSGNELKVLAEQVAKLSASVNEQSAAVAALQKESEAAKSSVSCLIAEVRNSAESARQLKEELQAGLASLKALSTHMQSSVKQKIADDMAELTREVRAKLEGSERLKGEVSAAAVSVNSELAKLRADLAKLSAVAAGIKAEDFELTKFAHQLQAADSEKLRLMQRIDSLELMIAKMRRQQVR